MAPLPLPLTVIVLTKDEERALPGCLDSVTGLAERLVVLDSGSSDATVAVARRYTAYVYRRPFDGYAGQRTAALSLAAHQWVLFLDADERLTPAGRAEIRATLAGAAPALDRAETAPVGYWIPRHNEFFGRRVRGGGWWPDAQLRLLRRDRARYDPAREVHEVVLLDGPAGRLREPLIHHNYDSWREFHAKQRAYAGRHARDLRRRGVRPRPWTYATQPVREFWRRYFDLGAWREGRLGLALAVSLAYYEGLAYWRMRDRPPQPPDTRGSRHAAGHGQVMPDSDTHRQATAPPGGGLGGGLDLSVIVVSRDTRELLRRCLAAVDRSLAGAGWTWETIVVDNASTDGTPAMVRELFPTVRLIESGENRGFAAGNNLGLREARGRAILLLNPDAEVVGDAIPTLLHALQAGPAIGVLGPTLRYPDGSLQESRRRFPTRLTPFLESTLVQRYWRDNRHLARYYLADRSAERRQDVDWLSGACLLVRRRAIERAGGLDESFFMYSEELDWCLRLRRGGWRIVYEPAASVIHHEGASSAQAVPHRHINFNSSKVLFYRRRYGAPFGEVLRAFLLLTYVVQGAQEGAKWLLGHKRPLRRQRLDAYALVLRSGMRSADRGMRNGDDG